jgi:hypothetical protein
MRRFPEKNHTASPVVVKFTDGSTKTYACGKILTTELGIGYSTVLMCIRENVSCAKFNIKSIKRPNPSKTTNRVLTKYNTRKKNGKQKRKD